MCYHIFGQPSLYFFYLFFIWASNKSILDDTWKPVSVSGGFSPCDWARETSLWHATKIYPGEWVIKGFFGRKAVSKNEFQHERRRHWRWSTGSLHSGSYPQWQLFKHCFAWLYLQNTVLIWTNTVYLCWDKCNSDLLQMKTFFFRNGI